MMQNKYETRERKILRKYAGFVRQTPYSYRENKLPTVVYQPVEQAPPYLRNESQCKSTECSRSSRICFKAYTRICWRIWHKLHVPRRYDMEGTADWIYPFVLFSRQKLHYLELLQSTRQHRNYTHIYIYIPSIITF